STGSLFEALISCPENWGHYSQESDTQLMQEAVGASGRINESAASLSSEELEEMTVVVPDSPAEPAPQERTDVHDSAELASRVSAACAPLMEASGMKVAVTVVDLETGDRASLGGDQKMVAASMIKLAIAAAFMDRVEMGNYALDQTYILQESDIVGGTGTLGGMGAGASVTYRELLDRMIDVSDNTAANILTNAVGMDAMNAKAAALGLSSTEQNRLMMDEAAVAAGVENYTSTDDLASLLTMIYRGQLVSPDASAEILHALEGQQDNAGIAQGLPDVVFAHKTGTLGTARNDAGIVEAGRPFVIAIMCGGDGFYQAGADRTLAPIGSAVSQRMEQ
ncbi:MAG: serine hydrolase, partial [Eggerthellaceae bacterium]|nr:serine hydrolase [Eggerthellaceae bacterium]